MTETMKVPVTVRWYSATEGGRSSGPPLGPSKYTPTGRFSDQALGEMFSVVLYISGPSGSNDHALASGEIIPLFPENVPDFAERLAHGDKFILHEGRRMLRNAPCKLQVHDGPPLPR